MARLSYNAALDGVRALAVIGVMCFHLDVLAGGYIGVDVFLVLSGYLITALMLAERQATGAISIRAFYLRRAYRLLPAFALFLAVGAVMAVLKASPAQREAFEGNAITALLYVNNYYRVAHPEGGGAWLGHVWSLSLEEQFYLLWPLCLLALAGRRRLPAMLLLGVALVAAWRLYLVSQGASHARIYNSLDTRCDALLVGCALGALREQGYPRWALRGAALGVPALLGLLLVAAVAPPLNAQINWLDRGGNSLVALLSAVLVLAIDREAAWSRVLGWRPLAQLGRMSYGFYLWHYPVSALVSGKLVSRVGPAAGVLIAGAVTLACAALSYRFLERPALAAGLRHQARLKAQPNTLESVSTPPRRSSGTIS